MPPSYPGPRPVQEEHSLVYQRAQHSNPLSEEHRQVLEDGSAIAREVLEGRGYRTTRRTEVPPEFKRYQRRAGLLVPLFSPDGTTTGYQLRPDKPRRDKRGKPIKYETPTGARIIADVHPTMLGAAADPEVPLWITEGVKCGDSLTSRRRCTVSLVGVWMFRAKGSPDMLPCFEHVALRGRRVFVVFDSDVMRKSEVQQALERLVGDLEGRGARVLVVYLPDAPDGGKLGVDDYLARGGNVAHLEEIARPFTRQDAARERMSRDERLRHGVAELWRVWGAQPWKDTGGHTRREIMRALIEYAESTGKPVEGGVRVEAAQRPIAERVGTGQKTVWRNLKILQEQGLIKRDTRKRAEDAPTAYILLTPGEKGRARGSHSGNKGGRLDGESHAGKAGNCGGYDPGDSPMRALEEIRRLRWSYVARVWAEDGYQHEYRERLGKIAGRVLEALIAAEGVATVAELAEAVEHGRPRDLRRRQIAKLQGAELARVEGDAVILADDWPEKLGIARELGREYEAEQLTRERHERQRAAYRRYRERGETLSPDDLARARREKQQDRREAREARRQRARDLDRDLRPNYWNWRKLDHLSRAGADGFLRELTPESEPEPPETARKLPPMVDGIYEHGALCDCAWCADSPEPSYASPAKVGAA
jgi:hypothetical protein